VRQKGTEKIDILRWMGEVSGRGKIDLGWMDGSGENKTSPRVRNVPQLIPPEPTLQRNFDLYIPRKETARPEFLFQHSCVCERFIYPHDRSTYFSAAEYADRSWEYINCTQKHECRNRDCGRAVPVLGILVYVSNFAVQL
jgi:hypothetical protein